MRISGFFRQNISRPLLPTSPPWGLAPSDFSSRCFSYYPPSVPKLFPPPPFSYQWYTPPHIFAYHNKTRYSAKAVLNMPTPKWLMWISWPDLTDSVKYYNISPPPYIIFILLKHHIIASLPKRPHRDHSQDHSSGSCSALFHNKTRFFFANNKSNPFLEIPGSVWNMLTKD